MSLDILMNITQMVHTPTDTRLTEKNIKNSNFFKNLSNFFPLISQRFKGYNCGKRG